jgi:hypothetical protein
LEDISADLDGKKKLVPRSVAERYEAYYDTLDHNSDVMVKARAAARDGSYLVDMHHGARGGTLPPPMAEKKRAVRPVVTDE